MNVSGSSSVAVLGRKAGQPAAGSVCNPSAWGLGDSLSWGGLGRAAGVGPQQGPGEGPPCQLLPQNAVITAGQ